MIKTNKAILISIRPRHVADILNGKKTLEIRKKIPNCKLPIDVYIYCTKTGALLFKEQSTNTYWAEEQNKNYRPKYALNGLVVAKFTLKKIEKINSYLEPEQWYMTRELGGGKLLEKSCLSFSKLDDYLFGGDGYAWHIDNLEIFDKPKELSEFSIKNCKTCKANDGSCYFKDECSGIPLTKAPQSLCYVEVSK